MSKKYVVIFDIETIPDHEAACNLIDIAKEATIEEKRKALTQYHLDITNGANDFLRQPFHKIVALSVIIAKRIEELEPYYMINHIGSGDNQRALEEKYLIESFFSLLDKYENPTLVSFNGRTFDIPVLKYRAMKHGIQGKNFYSVGTKWDSYSSRYALDWCCDLLEALSDFGASAKIKLNEVCSIFGFPGKFGVDGSKVTQMYDNNLLEDIRNYCETDVLNTYLVYLRYILHNNIISREGYNKSISAILDILKNTNDKKHYQEFLEAWKANCAEQFYL